MDQSIKLWGPKFWYVLHMIAFNYPKTPNDVTKKKYYETIMNIPLFLPNIIMGNKFSKLLDIYPVAPYLDSRESFIKWTHFIHNRINEQLGLPIFTYAEFIELYTKTKREGHNKYQWVKQYNIQVMMILAIIISLIYKLS